MYIVKSRFQLMKLDLMNKVIGIVNQVQGWQHFGQAS